MKNTNSSFLKSNKIFSKNFWKKFSLVVGIIGSLITIYVFIVPPKPETLQLTIFVKDKKDNVVKELVNQGELNFSLGNRSMNKKIGEDGRTNFGEISNQLKSDSITIGFQADGWQLVSKNKFVFTGEPIHLIIEKDNSLGIIKGSVRSRDGQDFISNALIQINTDTVIYSDSFGNFRIVLPERMRIKQKTDAYHLTISKEGYNTIEEKYYPSNEISIRLTEK